MKQPDVVIIGGGISGLATAWWLSRLGIKSTLLEQSKRTGGMIDTTDKDGYVTDHAASMILNFNASVTRLIAESGLKEHQVYRNKINHRYLLKKGKLIQVPETLRGMMLSDLFPLKTRLRLMSEPFRGHSQSDHETVANFIRRRLGQDLLDLAIDPYVSAVLGCDPEKACARSTLPRLTALEKTFGSFTAGILVKKLLPGKKGLPQEAFTFLGGMKTLTKVLTENPSIDMQTDHQVLSIEPGQSGWRINGSKDGNEVQHQAKQVVFSTPANITSHLLKPINAQLSGLLDRIQYAPMSQIHLGFDQSAFSMKMDGNGFLASSREQLPVRGSLWMSNLVDHRAPPGKLLTSNFIGGACQPNVLKKTDERLIDDSLSALQQLCGLKMAPEMARINRHIQGLPLYHGRYFQLTQAIKQGLNEAQGLHIVSSYLDGISIRDRIIQSESVAKKIAKSITLEKPLQPIQSTLSWGVS